jgi:hypothetical protein
VRNDALAWDEFFNARRHEKFAPEKGIRVGLIRSYCRPPPLRSSDYDTRDSFRAPTRLVLLLDTAPAPLFGLPAMGGAGNMLSDIRNNSIVLACDPVDSLVVSIARLRGRATGLTCTSSELTGNRLQLLTEAVVTAGPRCKAAANAALRARPDAGKIASAPRDRAPLACLVLLSCVPAPAVRTRGPRCEAALISPAPTIPR